MLSLSIIEITLTMWWNIEGVGSLTLQVSAASSFPLPRGTLLLRAVSSIELCTCTNVRSLQVPGLCHVSDL